jgi:peptidyl-prolyl cis-trans isomerase B (cyclophilin B)
MAEAPTMQIDLDTVYQVVITTNRGEITMELDPQLAPVTVNNFVVQARSGFYDGLTFHRVVPGFVIQGGDPTGTGTGGPGYKTVDTPPPGATYTQGVVAMAKAGDEAPGTSGSQFFVVTGGDIGLPPEYAVVGQVTEGMSTVLEIDALGVGDGPPSMPVVLQKVTVEEG